MKYVKSKKHNMLIPEVNCYICNDLGYFTDRDLFSVENSKTYCNCKVGKKLKLEKMLLEK